MLPVSSELTRSTPVVEYVIGKRQYRSLLEVTSTSTIRGVKKKIEDKIDKPMRYKFYVKILLTWSFRQLTWTGLQENRSLDDYGVRNGDTVRAILTRTSVTRELALDESSPWRKDVSEISDRDTGDWPRRLLHIPTMKSLTWRPGNRYGGKEGPEYEAPEYAALSYTWGKYRDETAEPISIGETEWPVPRIEPTHFTVHDFRRVINRIRRYSGTDFLWLDVACVNQGPDSDEGRLEVGRQAAIFRRAEKTYIWFTTLSEKDWPKSADPDYLQQNIGLFEKILNDPWFGSVWTLQEAYIPAYSYVLDRAGSKLPEISGCGDGTSFKTFTRTCTWLNHYSDTPRVSAARDVVPLLRKSGILAIDSGNPFILYGAAARRRATNKNDRIYGIQQIFGFQLGNTAPNKQTQQYDVNELEIQFTQELLKNYPVGSQMHVFAGSPNFGRGWHANEFSELPDKLPARFIDIFEEILRLDIRRSQNQDQQNRRGLSHLQCLCKFEPRQTESYILGHFSGQMCAFPDLLEAVPESSKVELLVALDYHKDSEVLADLESSVKYLEENTRRYISLYTHDRRRVVSNPGGFAFGKRLKNRHKCRLAVLKLGVHTRSRERSHDVSTFIGLMLMQESGYWRRLGFCLWRVWHPVEDYDKIQWTEEEGYFT
ncbi:uncharacterized protein Z518_07058 [Rhinocladiella mackenziei CBS 650.93]|uniref:Heterokaryon incompatibility domain-containing protein n=1 Tax=Rhinocladiella mackenziei CBS 650.93 TaxID=1442369 RepID=A0A0D2J3J4_9EURO|nr:uncharacterized protein Z518_07058 [Rhinocladiella mackenziei CBS 650.93]KIX03505.1 hypothetical protein Z518_07058 [Rhinocladiella mackenziei CBS 650.93]